MLEPAFYSNLPDDLHCSQACIRMVCEALGKQISWEEANAITGFTPGLYTWPPRSIINLNGMFPGTKYWTNFDYHQFVKNSHEYLLEYYRGNEKWVADQEAHATPGFEREHKDAQEMIDAGLLAIQALSAEQMRVMLQEYFIIAFVHFGILHGVDNNAGHAILVYDIQGDEVTFHDPGLPPRPGHRVSIDHFMKAYQNGATLVPRRYE
ncbi:MAG: hypothetical protein AAB473_02670 [Patescibacteria group bacterium]